MLPRCLLLVAACLLACALFLDFIVQRGLGLGELGRLPVLEQWYAAHAVEPQAAVVVLGDSLGRSAFNAEIWNAERPAGLPEAWNLASSAASYPELLLASGRPALRESTIVLFVSPVTSFNPSKLELNPRKANTYALLGLPDNLDDNIARYGQTLDPGSLAMLRRPRWQQLHSARWRLPEYLKDSLQVRFGARRERHRYLLEDYVRELRYPRFGESMSPVELEQAVARRLEQLADPAYSGVGDPRTPAALRDACRGLADNSRELVIVMYPLHPRFRDWQQREFPQYSAAWLQQQLGPAPRILDLSDYQAAGLFRDDLHVSDEGSEELTRRVLQFIAGGAG
ncbi:MAG: hypothetical protein R3F46_15685 [bacterium]